MIAKTHYTVNQDLLHQALNSLSNDEFKMTINKPTGNFFYDPWEIKEEYKDTVWGRIINTLPEDIGEARIITLKYGNCYQSHGDIDDRYHLSISGQYSYLINLETNEMHFLKNDGMWVEMDAGFKHSAANFGYINRVQLVVRKLLNRNILKDPQAIKIEYIGRSKDEARFKFDNIISPWLNKANKRKIITDFSSNVDNVKFKIEKIKINELMKVISEDFKIELL
jgi:hypothetical protein